jgi:hypothetical protein
MATFFPYPWYPGANFSGVKVESSPMVVAGYVQKQGGVRSWQPVITAPGTVASAGTVFNSTGLDCMVYLEPVQGTIGAIKILSSALSSATSYTIGGGVPIYGIAPVLVPGPGGVAVTYSGSLSWTWVPV